MIKVVIDLNLNHGRLSDALSTGIYVYDRKRDPLATGGTVIITNRTEKVPYLEAIFGARLRKIEQSIFFERLTMNTILCPGPNHILVTMVYEGIC